MNKDLISREALKEAFEEAYTNMELTFDSNTTYGDVMNIIDNAPTVELTEEQAIDKLHETGWLIRHDKEMTEPQGEWVSREDMDYLDENKVVHNHFECNKCGFIHDFIDGHTSQYNFCPNCGAKMRNKSLCDTCSHMFTCERSDVGISWATHSVCYGYVPVKNEERSDEE